VLEGKGGQLDTPAALLQGTRPLSILQEAEWAGLHDLRSLSSTGALTTDHPARSDLLYQLSWPSLVFGTTIFIYSCFLDDALCDDTDRIQSNYLSHFHVTHHIYHVDWFRIELVFLPQEAGE
jgi:hypothetical protein